MKNIGFFVEETQIPFMLLEELFDDDTFAIIFRGDHWTEAAASNHVLVW